MALTLTTNIGDYVGSFGTQKLVVSTNSATTNLVKMEVKTGSTVVATEYNNFFSLQAHFNLKNTFSSLVGSFDNPIAQAIAASLGVGSAVTTTVANHSKVYDLLFTEIATGTPTLERNSVRIHKAVSNNFSAWTGAGADFNPMLTAANGVIIRHAFADQYIPICIYSKTLNQVLVQRSEGGIDVETPVNVTLTNGFGVGVFRIDPLKVNRGMTLNYATGTDALVYCDYKCYPRKKTLYFLNRNGGWEWVNVVDYTETTKVDKLQTTRILNRFGDKAIHTNVFQEGTSLKCYCRAMTGAYAYYLKDLISSPVIVDETGVRVRLIDSKLDHNGAGLLKPEMTIEYLETETITS